MSLINPIPPRIYYVRNDPLNNPEPFWGPWRQRLCVLPVSTHFQVPRKHMKGRYAKTLVPAGPKTTWGMYGVISDTHLKKN